MIESLQKKKSPNAELKANFSESLKEEAKGFWCRGTLPPGGGHPDSGQVGC